MQFMRDGGPFMWLILFLALATLGTAIARRDRTGWIIALGGAAICLGLGAIGFSMGTFATMTFIASPSVAEAQRLTVLMTGLRETTNNILFGGLTAVGLAVLGVALAPRASVPAGG